MESFKYQYINCWNDYLYIYTIRRLRCSCNNEHCNYQPGHTNLYTDWSIVPEQYCTNTSCYIKQWSDRNMESIDNKYIYCRNFDLYIYSISRLRTSCNNEHRDYYPGSTHVYTDSTALSKQYRTITP